MPLTWRMMIKHFTSRRKGILQNGHYALFLKRAKSKTVITLISRLLKITGEHHKAASDVQDIDSKANKENSTKFF